MFTYIFVDTLLFLSILAFCWVLVICYGFAILSELLGTRPNFAFTSASDNVPPQTGRPPVRFDSELTRAP